MSIYFWKRTKTLVQPSACITVALDSGQLTFIFQGTDENQITMLADAMASSTHFEHLIAQGILLRKKNLLHPAEKGVRAK